MNKTLKDLIDVLNPDKMIKIVNIDMLEAEKTDYASITFYMSGPLNMTMTGTMPILKSKLSQFLKEKEYGTIVEAKKEEPRKQVNLVIPTKVEVNKINPIVVPSVETKVSSLEKKTRRIKCPKTGEYISRELFREKVSKGIYKGILK